MSDVVSLIFTIERLQRLLRQAAPRIEIHTEYMYASAVPQYLSYFSHLSQSLKDTLLPSDTPVVPQAADYLAEMLPRIELLADNRQWFEMLKETYSFVDAPYRDEILAAAGPLPGDPPSKPPEPIKPKG